MRCTMRINFPQATPGWGTFKLDSDVFQYDARDSSGIKATK